MAQSATDRRQQAYQRLLGQQAQSQRFLGGQYQLEGARRTRMEEEAEKKNRFGEILKGAMMGLGTGSLFGPAGAAIGAGAGVLSGATGALEGSAPMDILGGVGSIARMLQGREGRTGGAGQRFPSGSSDPRRGISSDVGLPGPQPGAEFKFSKGKLTPEQQRMLLQMQD